jgi:haloalkane dehalogenase
MTSRVVSSRRTFRTLPRPDWLPPDVWPFEAFGVPSGESLLAVTEVGSGPTLLFVHVGMWSFVWRDLVTRLAPDFRCIFFDAPGNGRTEDPPETAVSIERSARAVYDVINELGLTDLTLVAHDLGGPSALAGITEIPGRIRGIVGMNAFAWRPDVRALRFMLALMGSRFIREVDALTGFLPRIASSPFGVGLHMDERSRAAFLAGVGTRGRRAFHDYVRDARHCDHLYADVHHTLTGVLADRPLLTIFGERNDPFGFQRHWKQLFPEARQEVVARGNHFPMCDDPDLCARVIREWHRDLVG